MNPSDEQLEKRAEELALEAGKAESSRDQMILSPVRRPIYFEALKIEAESLRLIKELAEYDQGHFTEETEAHITLLRQRLGLDKTPGGNGH